MIDCINTMSLTIPNYRKLLLQYPLYPHSPHSFPYSLLPTPYSLLPTPYSLLPTPFILY
ncbi:hypothetical protein [Moorena sp. SIO3F7]|uniref:hypothetical protein n=2 Tax=Moorena TaxID=1155738 RepID=UPI0025EB10FD|nr:hypothetical protein [Moorena sp. SIO3F7]